MANVLVDENSMTAIANAIRAKKGVSTTYKPSEMADAISSISGGGGITPTGTINITTNGTHDVTQYASANVNVPTGGSTPTGTKQINITQNGITTEDVTNYASAEITVNVPTGGDANTVKALLEDTLTTLQSDATSIRTNMFVLSIITSVSFPECVTLNSAAFNTCSRLVDVSMPKLETIAKDAFIKSTALKKIVLPSARTLGATAFNACSALESADFGAVTTIGNSCFYSCSKLTVLILRGQTVATAETGSILANTPFASGKAGGTLYVPQALLSSYESATNWSTILTGNANNQILPIEGSIYETQYADGTPIS